MLFGDVLLLGVAERPDLITFDRLGGFEVGEFNVLVFGAGFPEIDQELGDGVLGGSGDMCVVARRLMPSVRQDR